MRSARVLMLLAACSTVELHCHSSSDTEPPSISMFVLTACATVEMVKIVLTACSTVEIVRA